MNTVLLHEDESRHQVARHSGKLYTDWALRGGPFACFGCSKLINHIVEVNIILLSKSDSILIIVSETSLPPYI